MQGYRWTVPEVFAAPGWREFLAHWMEISGAELPDLPLPGFLIARYSQPDLYITHACMTKRLARHVKASPENIFLRKGFTHGVHIRMVRREQNK